jgi:hypothetical protein
VVAKLLGVREVVHGAGQLPLLLQRAQRVSLMGNGDGVLREVSLVAPVVITLAAAGIIGWVIYSSRGR